MVQSEAAMEAYNAFFAGAPIPSADIAYQILILIIAIVALWQARTFVSKLLEAK